MAVEHWKNYQIELIPLELEGLRRWAAYVEVRKFDEDRQDFVRVLEKTRIAPATDFTSESQAIDEARRAANTWIETGSLPHVAAGGQSTERQAGDPQ
jgi:hypothetical protein